LNIVRNPSAPVRALKIAIAIVVVVTLIAVAQRGFALDYTVDRVTSAALTSYLRHHHLPLVGAQVLKTTAGGERLVLYGYVATKYGRNDAEQKALEYLKISGIPVENRIAIQPEIAQMNSHGASAAEQSAPGDSGNQSFDRVMDDIQRYGVKTPPGEQDLDSP
jgi:hypothetical protein